MNQGASFVIPAAGAPGGIQLTQGVSGRFFFIVAASENLNLQVFNGSSQVGDFKGFGGGLGQWFPDGFTRIEIQTVSGNAGTITLLVGEDISSYTALTGTVNVIDQFSGENQVQLGNAFVGNGVFGAAGAGEQSAMVLRNPVGSGKKVFVKNVICAPATGPNCLVGSFPIATALTGEIAGGSANKMLGGGASVCQVKAGHVTGVTPAGFVLFEKRNVNLTPEWDLRNREIMLPAGTALLIFDGTANETLNAAIEWEERI